LDCGGPLPLFQRRTGDAKAAGGLPQSKTLARSLNPDQLFGSQQFETALTRILKIGLATIRVIRVKVFMVFKGFAVRSLFI
jgi:hypothetical protein